MGRRQSAKAVESPLPSTPKGNASLRRSKRSSANGNATPDVLGDIGDSMVVDYARDQSIGQVLRAVEVPLSRKTRRSDISTRTPSSVTSLSLSDDLAKETKTPDTSAAPTPAETTTSRRKVRGVGKGKRPSALSVVSKAALSSSPTDRFKSMNRSGGYEQQQQQQQTSNDELLAKSLQQEYYYTDQSSKRKRTSRNADPEDEVESSDLSSVSSDESLYQSEDSMELEIAPRKRRPQEKPLVSRKPKSHPRKRSRLSVVTRPDERHVLADEDNAKLDDMDLALDGINDEITIRSALDADSLDLSESSSLDSESSRDVTPASAEPRTTRRRRRFRGRHFRRGMPRAERERLKLEESHPEILTLWQDLEEIPVIKPKPAEQPGAISRPLKSFQLEGLDWMCRQEKSKWKGGLLGDEMGMGKTIQAVSLIMSDYPAKQPTLVLVPPVALVQWSTEIDKYTNGKLKVLIHHNTDPKVKKLTVKDLKKYDVIMISYSGLESIYRKESKGWKRDDGLVKENSRIHAIHYHRLILDEAHNIKQRTTGVAKACFALKADYKWCLSGTPVQNRIGEFFSLLRFLEVGPFASYFCKVCPCSELHWSQDEEKKCTHCGHTGLQHVSIFNQELLTPITQAADPEERATALGKLRLITDRIMLRRLKRDHTASMELPPKEVVVHSEFFGEIERDFSSSIMTNTTRQFDTYVSRGVMLNNYANIFGLIMQMRQIANHPDLILKKKAQGGQNVLVCCICDETAEEPIRSKCHHEFCRKCAKEYVRSMEAGAGQADCPRCHIPLSIDFEQPDIEQDEDNVKSNSIINRINMENWTSSTKIEMLIYDLYKLRSNKQTHKSIVFSQFTSMLQLVEWRLRRAGFNTVMLDGTMSPAQRAKSIDYFMNNVDVEVFLVSLRAGGVALNLTEADRVFIIDPWWNPAAEWQSADRCHRIGQQRPCVVTRLCIEDSVESRMVLLQEKKANLISSTINHDTVAMEKLTPEDMQFLFRGN